MSYSIVGEQIQKFRKDIGLTQRELGEAIGVSSSAVSQWESGGTPEVKAALDLLVKLHIAKPLDLESDVGEISAYELCKQYDLVPLLYFARILMEPDGYYLGWITRKKPLFRGRYK